MERRYVSRRQKVRRRGLLAQGPAVPGHGRAGPRMHIFLSMAMTTRAVPRLAALLSGALLLLGCAGRGAAASPTAAFPDPPAEPTAGSAQAVAVLAGGCFWGMEGVFERLNGVSDVLTGYSGGNADTAHYEMVGSGSTGHAESIQVTFDPSVISYGTLLKVYFAIAHDPTQLDYQGPDQGTQYRSAIFYASDAQKAEAEAYIKALSDAKVFPQPIVTQVVPLKAFYPAEDYHQDFMDHNPTYPYIVFWDKPKVQNLQKSYPSLLSGKYPKL
jgi:peptide-methionine (S)-S-oxide reductase